MYPTRAYNIAGVHACAFFLCPSILAASPPGPSPLWVTSQAVTSPQPGADRHSEQQQQQQQQLPTTYTNSEHRQQKRLSMFAAQVPGRRDSVVASTRGQHSKLTVRTERLILEVVGQCAQSVSSEERLSHKASNFSIIGCLQLSTEQFYTSLL